MHFTVKVLAVLFVIIVVMIPFIKRSLIQMEVLKPEYEDREVLYQHIASKTIREELYRTLYDWITFIPIQVILIVLPLVIVAVFAGMTYFIPFGLAMSYLAYKVSSALIRIGYYRRNPSFKIPT